MTDQNLLTEEELERAGLEALRRELGLVGMIRFLQLFDRGRGDYTEERHEWLDAESMDTIVERIRQMRARAGGSPPESAGA